MSTRMDLPEGSADRGCRANEELETVGAVPLRAAMGNRGEDYSARRMSWDYFPHDQARSRAYRWGEDGLLGITDREGRLCFALASGTGGTRSSRSVSSA